MRFHGTFMIRTLICYKVKLHLTKQINLYKIVRLTQDLKIGIPCIGITFCARHMTMCVLSLNVLLCKLAVIRIISNILLSANRNFL